MSRFFDLLVANEVYADIDFIMSPQEDGKEESFYLDGTLTSLVVDWGDGTTTTASTTNSHTYTSAGDYRVRVLGDCSGVSNFYTSDSTSTKKDVTKVNRLYLPNLLDGSNMFRECNRLTEVKVFYAPRVTNLFACFYNCTSLTSLPEDMILSSRTIFCGNVFFNCRLLEAIPECFATAIINNAYFFIYNCKALTSLPSGFTLANCTDVRYTFGGCNSLVWTPLASDFWERVSPQVQYDGHTFQGCTSMTNYSDIPTAWKDGQGTVLYQPPNE